jgi:hypothetical protein
LDRRLAFRHLSVPQQAPSLAEPALKRQRALLGQSKRCEEISLLAFSDNPNVAFQQSERDFLDVREIVDRDRLNKNYLIGHAALLEVWLAHASVLR